MNHQTGSPSNPVRLIPSLRIQIVKPGAIETALLTLADRLDQPFSSGGDPDSVAMMLAHRARDLFRGYLACTAEDIPAAARLLLRPAVEVNILLRFIREDPEWRPKRSAGSVAHVARGRVHYPA